MKLLRALTVLIALFSIACSGNGNSAPTQAAATPAFLTKDEAWSKINSGALLLDVRSKEEYDAGHLPGAINIPHDQIAAELGTLQAEKQKEIVLYCKSGRRAGIALDTLKGQGFSKLYNAGAYTALLP